MSNWNYNEQDNKSSVKDKVENIGITIALGLFLGVIIFAGYLFMNIDKHSSELNFMIPLAITVALWVIIPLSFHISERYKVKRINSFLVVLLLVIVLGFVASFVSAVTKAANEPRATFMCDYCGDTTNTHQFTVGKVKLCGDCYTLYKRGN